MDRQCDRFPVSEAIKCGDVLYTDFPRVDDTEREWRLVIACKALRYPWIRVLEIDTEDFLDVECQHVFLSPAVFWTEPNRAVSA